jgi:hypothetical protein
MATNGSVFAKYIEAPEKELAQKPSHAQLMLDWLQRWPKPTICRRDVRIYGPSSVRDRQSMLSSAEVLVRYGWLVPIDAGRHDGHRWRIVRKPVVRPIVAK